MKQTLSIKTGSGSSTGSLTFSASALTHTTTDYTLVTLPSTPGYIYNVVVQAYITPTTEAGTAADKVKAYVAGYPGTLMDLSDSALTLNTKAQAQLFSNSNTSTNGGSLGNDQAAGLATSFPAEGIVAGPGEAIVISIDTFTGAASTTSAVTYNFKYRYIGKAILTGTF